ncbi:hypothetical protein [Agromyces bauzanensis]
MRSHRITDDDAAVVMRGQVPEARDDLAVVAHAVAVFRRDSLEPLPQPSAALAARLDLERAARISASADELYATTSATAPANRVSTPGTRRRRVALSGFLGLGLATKIAIGVGAAALVGVGGAGAAGAAGVLPEDVQVVFNDVTGHPGNNVSETGLENSEFGQQTAEDARQKGEEKREAALQNAEEKRQAGLENAAEHAGTGQETAGEHAQTGQETADEKSQAGEDAAGGAADGAGDIADEKSQGKDAGGN